MTDNWVRSDVSIWGADFGLPATDHGWIHGPTNPDASGSSTLLRTITEASVGLTYTIPEDTFGVHDGWWSRLTCAFAVGVYSSSDNHWPIQGTDGADRIVATAKLVSSYSPGLTDLRTGAVTLSTEYPLSSKGMRKLVAPIDTPIIRTAFHLDWGPDFGLRGMNPLAYKFSTYVRALFLPA